MQKEKQRRVHVVKQVSGLMALRAQREADLGGPAVRQQRPINKSGQKFFLFRSTVWGVKDVRSSKLMTTVPPVLIYFLQLGVQRPLVVGPVGEDVSHGAAGLVETQVEAAGVNLRTICDFKD